jgi:hypothetical protein
VRSFFIILITLGLAAGAFLAYFLLQPEIQPPQRPPVQPGPAARASSGAPPTLPATAPAGSSVADSPAPAAASDASEPVFQEGQDVWIKTYDQETGLLASQFRAARYEPRPDGTVDVTSPEAEFHQRNGQVLRIAGARGRVVMPGGTGSDPIRRSEPPSRGELFDVQIELLESVDATEPWIRCSLNNVSFDNDTFRIAAESYVDEQGRTVPADRVPVVVRGQEYDFDGQGLTIRWNDRDQRLESLEIAHGGKIVLKNPSSVVGGLTAEGTTLEKGKGAAAASAGGPALVNDSSRRADVATQASVPSNLSPAAVRPGATPPPGRPQAMESYRATLSGQVKVMQGLSPLAEGDVLHVDLTSGTKPDRVKAPDVQPAANDAVQRPTNAPAAPQTTASAVAGAVVAESPATTETGARTTEPLVLTWDGPLRVVPLEQSETTPPPGEVNIELHGNPTIVRWEETEVLCGVLRTEGDRLARALPSASIPRVSINNDAQGLDAQVDALQLDLASRKATLFGASQAQFPLRRSAEGNPEIVKANWSKSCSVVLRNTAQKGFERVELRGEVSLDSPSTQLRADSLDVIFSETSETSETDLPGEIEAVGSVRALIIDAQSRQSTLSADRLRIRSVRSDSSPAGAQVVTASGRVRITESSGELQCEALEAEFDVASSEPGQTADAGEAGFASTGLGTGGALQKLVADRDVRFVSSSGTSGSGARLLVTESPAGQEIRLIGQPTAKVSDGENELVGPILVMLPQTQQSSVAGAGAVRLAPREGSVLARPITVSWGGSFNADGRANRAEMTGGVEIRTLTDDDSVATAVGKSLTIDLEDSTTTQSAPTTQPMQSAQASQIPQTDSAFRSISEKSIRKIVLHDAAEIRSVLNDPQGKLLRRIHVLGDELWFEPAARKLSLPGPGRMLFDDRRPRDEASASSTQPSTGPTAEMLARGFSGATAFKWDEGLAFDENSGVATMSGNVLIVHQDRFDPRFNFHMTCRTVSAELAKDPATRPSEPAAATGALPSAAQLRSVAASGGVNFKSQQIELDAGEVQFDPNTGRLTARGTSRQPVQVFGGGNISRGTFQELVFNTRTDEIERVREFRGILRR